MARTLPPIPHDPVRTRKSDGKRRDTAAETERNSLPQTRNLCVTADLRKGFAADEADPRAQRKGDRKHGFDRVVADTGCRFQFIVSLLPFHAVTDRVAEIPFFQGSQRSPRSHLC